MEITFEALKKEPFYYKLITTLESNLGKPLNKPLQDFILSHALYAVERAANIQHWLNIATSLAYKIQKNEAHSAEYPLFWIRIYSIVFEYCEYMDKSKDVYEIFTEGKELLDSLTAIRESLSEEELTYIHFMRNSHCHIQIDYHLHKVKVKEGEIVGGKPPKNTNVMETVRTVLEKHSFDQPKVAVTYAKKLYPHLVRLATALSKIS